MDKHIYKKIIYFKTNQTLFSNFSILGLSFIDYAYFMAQCQYQTLYKLGHSCTICIVMVFVFFVVEGNI